NLNRARRREHSRKPPNAHRYMDGILPNEFGAELFARQSRAGWDCWGNEVGKFDAPSRSSGGER
ncbi:MAG: MT-A70 family methyltransferase, partial [Rhodospirillales bacterium]